MAAKRKIIIDTDPGQDDAMAIMLALASPDEIEVDAVVTVVGNVSLEQTSRNALMVLELAKRADVPVYAGCASPMRRVHVAAMHVHGPTGLDGPSLPTPTTPLRMQHGVEFLVDTLLGAEVGTYTVCALGPLTNIATALVRAPEIAPRLREIVMMGGAYFEVGNITPAAARRCRRTARCRCPDRRTGAALLHPRTSCRLGGALTAPIKQVRRRPRETTADRLRHRSWGGPNCGCLGRRD